MALAMQGDNGLDRAGVRRLMPVVIFAAALTLAPAANPAAAAEKVYAYVGGEPVTSGDVEALGGGPLRGLDEAGRLGHAIKNKALVQKALKEGVYREPGYMDEMQACRQRALVRALLARKSRELAGTVTATEEELAAFTDRMCYTVRFYEKEFGEAEEAEKFMAQGRGGKPQEWDGDLTVVGCENIGPLMADKVFSLSEGEAGLVARGRRFTVVRLLEKKKTIDESLLPDKRRIREYLMEKKRAEALDAWVDEVVGEARVRYVDGPGRPDGEAGARKKKD